MGTVKEEELCGKGNHSEGKSKTRRDQQHGRGREDDGLSHFLWKSEKSGRSN